MAGMQTRLHLIADRPGSYAGTSANFSGRGFSDMKFRTLAEPREQFDAWVQKVKASPERLDATVYGTVAQPSERRPCATSRRSIRGSSTTSSRNTTMATSST